MNDIKNIRTPPILPEVGVPHTEIEEGAYETWAYRSGQENFNFIGGKILMNNQDLSNHISSKLSQLPASYWTQISRRLEDYRQWVLSRAHDPELLSQFAAMVYALLNKIGGRLKRRFDEKMDGISFHLEDGELFLNGININAFIEMSKKNPSQKTKVFLKGLKNRLGIMLANRFGNPNYEKISETVETLITRIDEELAKAPMDVICLPPR